MIKYLLLISLLFYCLFNLVHLQSSCGVATPNTRTDCTQSNTNQQYCCYLTSTGSGNTTHICYPFQVGSTISPNMTVAGALYTVDCGTTGNTDPCIAQNTIGTISSKYYCTDHSTSVNSCCMYTVNGVNKCQWLGAKFDGSTQVGSIALLCSGNVLIYSTILLMIVALMILG